MIEIRRADDRFVSQYDGVESRHSFSFGSYYDPANVGFGMLVCHNDDTLAPGHGYDEHPHRDLEIVTWVLVGELHHQDSTGISGVVVPGVAQRMSAGSGVLHSEYAGPGPTRFVQMWVRPDAPGLAPSYEQRPVDLAEDWVTVASGMGHDEAAVRIRNSRAALHATRLGPGGRADISGAPYLHLFVCSGEGTLATGALATGALATGELATGELLRAGDAVRVTGGDGLTFSGEAELLVWEMHGAS